MARSKEPTTEAAPRFAGASANYLLRHLIAVSTAIRRNIGEEIEARGHEISPALSQVIVNLPVDGLGMTELAGRLLLTLQRTGQLVSHLEEVGYVERIADEYDGRAKRVVYTRRGRGLLADIDAIDETVTKEIPSILGEQRFAQLRRELEALDEAFNGPDGILSL